MDKLSEYLPFLIVLLTVVFSFAGKRKKPVKTTQETMLPGKTAGEFIGERQSSQTSAVSYQKRIDEKPKKQAINKSGFVKENRPLLTPETATIETGEEKLDSTFSFDEENLVQAVIYSEIINRKEY